MPNVVLSCSSLMNYFAAFLVIVVAFSRLFGMYFKATFLLSSCCCFCYTVRLIAIAFGKAVNCNIFGYFAGNSRCINSCSSLMLYFEPFHYKHRSYVEPFLHYGGKYLLFC
ncbi:hypothetical protein K7X08_036695 [Anisodus acutangulus]|uniref:Uncharacterized protein n=1 Tax=Anisodus acutangulus TaxID=402998 RepID=A0A9Q1L921_9SOLA|nr:hypothetical protein K7X08_036695 [Anisodus acutangulus]